MEGVVPPIADVTSDPPELGLVNGVATFPLHVISRLVEITNPWNVAFLLSTYDISMVVNID